MVEDGVRAQIYGVLRIPLNIFVVAALATTKEGDEHREKVFLGCGALLVLASVVAAYALDEGGKREYERVGSTSTAASGEVWSGEGERVARD